MRRVPELWIDMQTGRLTREALLFLDDLQYGRSSQSPGINTVLAGVTRTEAKVDSVIDGTQALATVIIPSLGDISSVILALSANIGLSSDISFSPSVATATITGAGSALTNSVTATANFGTGPYTYAWTYQSGDSFTITSPSAAATTFSTSLTDGQIKAGIYRCTATDSLSATAHADLSVTAISYPVN